MGQPSHDFSQQYFVLVKTAMCRPSDGLQTLRYDLQRYHREFEHQWAADRPFREGRMIAPASGTAGSDTNGGFGLGAVMWRAGSDLDSDPF